MLAEGLMNASIINVIDIALVGVEEIYSTASHLDVDGGIEVTTSYNPIGYNGMKLVDKAMFISGL